MKKLREQTRGRSRGGGSSQLVIVVAGPTASGKSALALTVASAFSGTVINADSIQVYRELRILSNRPSPSEEASSPHRLFGVFDAVERCSAANWRNLAITEISSAHAQGRLPIVVGGTGLYLKALLEGLSRMPAIPHQIRANLKLRLAKEGPAVLHNELKLRDPAAAERLNPGDSHRVMRALEIHEYTGCSITEFQARSKIKPPAGLNFKIILLQPPREGLYKRCDDRLVQMLEKGVVDEVKEFLSEGYDPDLPIMKALGLAEFGAHLNGQKSLEQALKETQQATRRYAKRQMTWFRTQIIADIALIEQHSESLSKKTFSFIRQNMLTNAE